MKSTLSHLKNTRNKVLFENLTPLFPQERLRLEAGMADKRPVSANSGFCAPIGKGSGADGFTRRVDPVDAEHCPLDYP